ncbi:MAG: DNA replication/repair protein RecF [Alicyclobacillaceae bacterium]|nr:DNA replication/repair protein RecF [Alicyclobacillaceae bacterium]
MFVRELHLHRFRNYRDAHIRFAPGVNVLVGDNAQGKTNALEAIYVLAVGRSHRTHRDTDLISWGDAECTVKATVRLRDRDLPFHLAISPAGKRAAIAGVPVAKMTDFVGHFQVVLFAPEDLALVKGGPGTRRRFVDLELAQTERMYLFHLGQYMRALRQRNLLLKSDPVDWQAVDVFEAQMVEHGADLLSRRFRFMLRMQVLAGEVYASLSTGEEQLSVEYACSIPGLSPDAVQLPVPELRAYLAERFRTVLLDRRQRDRQFGHTTVGPHRDDVALYLNGRPAHTFASQGQQRSVALALRLAELEFIREEIGEYPVLLLDDVLSELDDSRQHNLVWNISRQLQTIITTTSLRSFQCGLPAGARLFHVRSGIIQEEG